MQTLRLPSFTGFRANQSAPRPAARKIAVQRSQLCVRAATVAAPAELEVKKLDGSSAGTAQLSLKVAEEDTAKGLVHRCGQLVQRRLLRRGIGAHGKFQWGCHAIGQPPLLHG